MLILVQVTVEELGPNAERNMEKSVSYLTKDRQVYTVRFLARGIKYIITVYANYGESGWGPAANVSVEIPGGGV